MRVAFTTMFTNMVKIEAMGCIVQAKNAVNISQPQMLWKWFGAENVGIVLKFIVALTFVRYHRAHAMYSYATFVVMEEGEMKNDR